MGTGSHPPAKPDINIRDLPPIGRLWRSLQEICLMNKWILEPARGGDTLAAWPAPVPDRISVITADARAIAGAIELSADSIGGRLTDNRVRLGALCVRLVGECVHEINYVRYYWRRKADQKKIPVVWPTLRQIKPYTGKSQTEVLKMASGASLHSTLTVRQWQKRQRTPTTSLRRRLNIPHNQPHQPNPMRAAIAAAMLRANQP